ncbi:MAG: hypothetical protein GXO06_02600, partial [Epsilonproteobacteria bacterium]|nr:hypothetical protein [Campylobacterota bacterium]
MLKAIFAISIFIFSGCFDDETPKRRECNATIFKDKNRTVDGGEGIFSSAISEEYTEEQNNLRCDFELYLEYLRTLNTEGIIDMTYPELFKPINRRMFTKFINTLLDSPEISIEKFDAEVTDVGDIIDYGEGKFTNLEYISTIKLNFVNPNLYKDDTSMRVLKSVLENKYGKENILVDKDSRTIMIKIL